MSFAKEIITSILNNRHVVISDPIIDRYLFKEGIPGPYPAEIALNSIARLMESQQSYDFLGSLLDEQSRSLLKDIVTYRALGPQRYALPMSTPAYMDNYKKAASYRTGPSENVFPPFEFENFKLKFMNHDIDIGAWLGNIAVTFFVKQYYLDSPCKIQPEQGDIVIDGGGCFGDTALAFAASIGERGKVFSFDPLPAHQAVMRSNFERNPELGQRIQVMPHALSHVAGEVVRLSNAGAGSKMVDGGEIEAKTDTIDQLVQRQGLAKVDFIKMDIEGAERSALLGARETIARFKPKLAIASYHSDEDLVVIPLFIKHLNPEYKIHIGHYTNFEWETVVYAA